MRQACPTEGGLGLWQRYWPHPHWTTSQSFARGWEQTRRHLTKCQQSILAWELQEWEGGEMGPFLCCIRMPCLLAIPRAPGLSSQGNLEGKPVEAQRETGFSQGVWGSSLI